MAQYANQKTIIVNREEIDYKSGRQYLQVYSDNIARASRNLSGEVPFKLYLYFLSNRNNYKFDFSPKDFSNVYGCSAEVAKRAFGKLEEAGYITHDINNRYEFHEVPQKPERLLKYDMPAAEQRYVPDVNGEAVPATYMEIYNLYKDEHSEEEIKNYWNSLEVCNNG